MIVLVGASASGKTELAKILMNSYGYHKCVTTTTRLMRNNEKQDVDYHFISKDIFKEFHSEDLFVEVTYYHDHFYGIQKKDVDLNGVVIVDPTGANSLIAKMGQSVFLVYVESNEILRRSRMLLRGDDPIKIAERLLSDAEIFQSKNLIRIDLTIKNERNSLQDLASLIHKSYQTNLQCLVNR